MNYQNQKRKYDVLRFVKRYIKEYAIISNGKEISVNCTFCSPKDYKKKLTVNAKSGLFHCWKCNEKGNFFKFTKQYGKSTVNIENFLVGTNFSGSIKSNETETLIQYPESFRFLSDSVLSVTARPYFKYLFDRGLTISDIDYYSIGYCTSGKLAQRVVVPVFKGETLVSYIARTIGTELPKVLTPPSLPGTHGVKDYVYNLDRAKETKLLYIGEGVFDAIALGIHGICLFGKEATKRQLAEIINTNPRRIVVCLDGDAYKNSRKLANQLLLHNSDVRIAKFPEDQDPSSLSKEDREYYISQALRFDGSIEL
jgi:DNA primase